MYHEPKQKAIPVENQETSPAIQGAVQAGSIRFIGDVGPLFEALAKAQAEFVDMDRDAQVKFEGRMFKYATLAEVLASVRPALNRHGLALLQPFDGDKVTTMLVLGGARLEVDAGLPDWKGVQALGSALTYIKRYQVKSLLGVNDGEDDDGNAADGTGKAPEPRTKATPPQPKAAPAKDTAKPVDPDALTPETRSKIGALGKAVGFNRGDLEAFSVKHDAGALDELNEPRGLKLVAALEGLKVQS